MPATKTAAEPAEKNHTDNVNIGRTAYSILHNLHSTWSVDELLLNPREGLKVCRLTRSRLKCQRTDNDILRALLNCRKRGHLKTAN